jgi:putative endonuclease
MYYVYVLHSSSYQGLYIGYSRNLRRRLAEHEAGDSISTRRRGPWRLIYYEAYLDEGDALGREKFLKSGAGREYLHRQCRHYFLRHPSRTTA